MNDELADLAKTVIDSNRYMALGTADESGHPWVSPVWFASADYRRFHWVSPDTRHSHHLAARPEVAIAVYDSSRAPGTVEAVYMSGWAEGLTGAELERGIELFDRVSRKDSVALGDWPRPSRRRSSVAIARRHWSTSSSSEAATPSAARGSTAARRSASRPTAALETSTPRRPLAARRDRLRLHRNQR